MFRHFAFAIVGIFITVSFADSETFMVMITKVEDNKVTYKKATHNPGLGKPGYFYDEPVTVEATKDAEITQGHYLPVKGTSEGRMTDKKVPIKDGLRNATFNRSSEQGIARALITIADEGTDKGKVTAINILISGSPK
jgi:hypothetical protein